MEIKRICQIYFSPTGTTEKVVQAVSAALADDLDVKSFIYDFTLPQARTSFPQLGITQPAGHATHMPSEPNSPANT